MTERGLYIAPENAETDKPIIFLAGPIQGARDWQNDAIDFIHFLNPEVVIASPRRVVFEDGHDTKVQVKWETAHLRRAGENGAVLFWLAKEEEHIPGRSFARTTRIEFGEWMARHELTGSKLVVGIEDGFDGATYIRERLEEYPDIPILSTLQDTCITAINVVKVKPQIAKA